jgi:hypothetical protein
MPKKVRAKIGRQPRRRSSAAVGPGGQEAETLPPDEEAETRAWESAAGVPVEEHTEARAAARLRAYAVLAWEDDYEPMFMLEAELNGAVAEAERYESSYRARQVRGGDENARRRSVKRISADLERLRRERNVHYVPFSQAVKGAVFLIDQVKSATWDAERRARRVVKREYAHDLLQAMVDVRPPPPEPANDDVDFFVFDQTYASAGGGHGAGSTHANPVGRIDDKGERIKTQRETYIISFDVHIGTRELQLSDAARDLIGRRGPYTEDFARVLPVLAPQRCDRFMDDLIKDACARLRELEPVCSTRARERLSPARSSALSFSAPQESGASGSVRDFMLAILGRRDVDVGGPARLTDLPPLMRTDTAKLEDGVKILNHYVKWRGRKALIQVAIGDGQSVLMLSYLKRHWPDTYKHVLIMNGHFHSCAAARAPAA